MLHGFQWFHGYGFIVDDERAEDDPFMDSMISIVPMISNMLDYSNDFECPGTKETNA